MNLNMTNLNNDIPLLLATTTSSAFTCFADGDGHLTGMSAANVVGVVGVVGVGGVGGVGIVGAAASLDSNISLGSSEFDPSSAFSNHSSRSYSCGFRGGGGDVRPPPSPH